MNFGGTSFRSPTGETPDTIAVWLPDKRVLMPGDNFLRAFPNVSPIRGARLRNPDTWIASLNRVIALQPEHVVPSHTRPVLGARAAAGDFRWAAELADYVLVNDPTHVAARRLKAQALTELGERQINAIARNYYLTSAQFLLKDLPPQ